MLPVALDLDGELGPVLEGAVLIPHASGREDRRNLRIAGGLNFFNRLSPVTNICWAG